MREIKMPVFFAEEYEKYYTSPRKLKEIGGSSIDDEDEKKSKKSYTKVSTTTTTTRKRTIGKRDEKDEEEEDTSHLSSSESDSKSDGDDGDFDSSPELASSSRKSKRTSTPKKKVKTSSTSTSTSSSTSSSTSTSTSSSTKESKRGRGKGKENENGIFHFERELLENSQDANVEICFSFDTTGSMSGYINNVKDKLENIAKQLITDLPNIRISIVAHGDYCDSRNYILRRIDLSNDHKALSKFIQETKSTGGGDADEAYELVLRDVQSLSWSNSSNKALVIIGDAGPHQPHQYRKIDWKEELNILKGMGIKVYGVRCGCSLDFYQKIAEETGGSTLDLDKFNEISELMSGLAYREAAVFQAQQNEMNVENKDEQVIGKMVRMPSNANDKNGLDSAECFRIHEAIHRNEKFIQVNGIVYDIAIGRAGCKFVRVGEQTFIEQNKDKNSKYSRMAAQGRKITWIIQRGNWGLIMGETTIQIDQEEAKIESGHN